MLSKSVCLLAFLASSAFAQSHPTFWRYSHPEARALVGIDIERMAKSPFGVRMKKELDQFGAKKMAAGEGMDFLADVDRVLISTPGRGGEAAAAGPAKDAPPVVIALQGKFKVNSLRAGFLKRGARRSLYQGAELFHPRRGKTDMDAALVNSSILLLGDPDALRLTLDHFNAERTAGEVAPLFQRAAELGQIYDLWFTAETSPADLAASNVPNARLLEAVRSFEGGLTLNSGLGLELSLSTEKDEDAQQLAAMLQGLLQMGALAAEDEQARDLLRKIRIGRQNALVSATLRYSQQELDRGLDQAKAAFFARTGAGPAVRAKVETKDATSAPADPPAPLTVKILNLETGPREVAFR